MYIDIYVCKACETGTYGKHCTGVCGNCSGEWNCNHTTGICANGCIAGFKGESCKESTFIFVHVHA